MATELPPHPDCPLHLSPDEMQLYQKNGFLAYANCLTPAEVKKAKAAITELIAGYQEGAPYVRQMEPGTAADGLGADDLELRVRKLMNFHRAHAYMQFLVDAHPRLRGVVASLLGQGALIFQSMALIKPPHLGSEKPWHQDTAYFNAVPLDAVLGIWLALDDARVANGCMHVLPGQHRRGPLRHCLGPVLTPGPDGKTLVTAPQTDCQLIAARVDPAKAVPIELPAGGVLFFHGLLPHQTPANCSGQRRRALQFHYRAGASRLAPPTEFDQVFAEAYGVPCHCRAAHAAAAAQAGAAAAQPATPTDTQPDTQPASAQSATSQTVSPA